jgi:uncharacterized protein
MGTRAKQGEFCWNELMTADVKKAKAFYQSLFGWEMEDHDMGNGVYTMLKQGETGIGGMMQIPKGREHIPPHWMSYIYVENLDESVKKAKSLGAKIKVEITSIADYGKFAVIEDPTGAYIALWQSLRSC